MAEVIQDCIRPGDVTARYGGEEFSILLHQVTREQAFTVVDRIRRAIENAPFAHQELQDRKNLTISGGIAQFPEDGNNVAGLLDRADQQMYQAKKQQNAICPSLASQRRTPRHRLQSLVKLSPTGANTFYTGLTFDISQGGIAIGSGIDFQMGSTMHLRFCRPFWPVDCKIQGTIRYVAKEKQDGIIRVGLEFDSNEELVRPLLQAFKADISPDQVQAVAQ